MSLAGRAPIYLPFLAGPKSSRQICLETCLVSLPVTSLSVAKSYVSGKRQKKGKSTSGLREVPSFSRSIASPGRIDFSNYNIFYDYDGIRNFSVRHNFNNIDSYFSDNN